MGEPNDKGRYEHQDSRSPGDEQRERVGGEPAGSQVIDTGAPTINRRATEAVHEEHDKDDRNGHGSPRRSRIWSWVITGVVALVCGVVGAWGFSYFSGSSKSGGHKSASEESDSSKQPDSSKDSETSKSAGSSKEVTSKLAQAEEAWLSAVKELKQAREAEKTARSSEEKCKAVLDFLKTTLLSAGRPGDKSLSAAFWAAGQGKDVTLLKALDETESQVGEAFADRPLAESSVREMLGQAYLNLGEAPRAVKQYERALALRQAMEGANDPNTAACRNQLAVAYRMADLSAEGARLFEQNPNSEAHASALAVQGAMLLAQKKPADAELKLRECLKIRQKIQSSDSTTFETESQLGEALLDQKRFEQAEPLLLSGYEGMRKHQDAMPSAEKPLVTRALKRIVKLYDDWGKKDDATRWRKKLEK